MSTYASRLGTLVGVLFLSLALSVPSAFAGAIARQSGTCSNGVKWSVSLDAQYLSLSMSGRKLTPNTDYAVTASVGSYRVTAADNSEGKGQVKASEQVRHNGALTGLSTLQVTCDPS